MEFCLPLGQRSPAMAVRQPNGRDRAVSTWRDAAAADRDSPTARSAIAEVCGCAHSNRRVPDGRSSRNSTAPAGKPADMAPTRRCRSWSRLAASMTCQIAQTPMHPECPQPQRNEAEQHGDLVRTAAASDRRRSRRRPRRRRRSAGRRHARRAEHEGKPGADAAQRDRRRESASGRAHPRCRRRTPTETSCCRRHA